MPKVRFCYEIAKEEGLATTSDGENAKAYVDLSIDLSEEPTKEQYDTLHNNNLKEVLCKQTNFNAENVKPISIEEYEENADDEDYE